MSTFPACLAVQSMLNGLTCYSADHDANSQQSMPRLLASTHCLTGRALRAIGHGQNISPSLCRLCPNCACLHGRVCVECVGFSSHQQYLRALVKGTARHIRTLQLWMSPEPKHSQTLNPHVRLRHGPSLCRRHSTSLLFLSVRYRPAVVMAPESEGEQSPMQTSRSATQAGANTEEKESHFSPRQSCK